MGKNQKNTYFFGSGLNNKEKITKKNKKTKNLIKKKISNLNEKIKHYFYMCCFCVKVGCSISLI